MKNYKEMEKELVDYVKNTSSDSIDLERFLRFQNYGLILDFDSLSNDFFRWNPRMITNTIFAMLAIKSKFEMDRPRKKEDGSLYKYFKKQYGQLISENRIYDFSREDFEHFYHCFCGYTLTPLREENIKNSVHVFSKFLTDHFNQKEIYDILSKLNDDPEQFLNHTVHDVFDEQLVQDFQNQLRKAIRGSEFSTVLIQTLSSIYMKNQKESLIENHILYYLFTSNLNCFNDTDYEGAVLLDASPFFIRKWIRDPKLKNVHTLFVFSNENLSTFWKKNFEFRSNLDSIFYSDLDQYVSQFSDFNNQILVFGNHILDTGIKFYLIDYLLRTMPFDSFYYYDYDEIILNNTEISLIFAQENLSEIHLFPSGINDVKRRQRSSFLKFKSGNHHLKFNVTHYTLNKEGQYQALSPRIYSQNLPQEQFFKGRENIRKIFNDGFKESTRKTNQQRKTAELFHFTEEIIFYFTKSYDSKNNSYRVGAYAVEPRFLKDGTRDSSSKVKLPLTLKNCRQSSKEEIENWLNFEYPYSIRKGENPIDIRKEICSVYKQAYKNKPITLKTFVYFYLESIKNRYGDKQMEIVLDLCEVIFGRTLIDDFSSFFVNEILDNLYESVDDESKKYQAKALLSDLIDQAIKMKHATVNQIKDEVIKESNLKDKAYYQSRKHLTIKYFSQTENIKLYKHIKKNLEKDSRYLGAYIKLVTGLESNIVCALQWKDFVPLHDYNEDHDKYQLIIRKQLYNDGSGFAEFSRKELYRKVPCSEVLTEVLLIQRQEVMNKCERQNEKDIGEFSIVEGNLLVGENTKVISPTSLSAFCGKLVKKLRKGYSLISEIPDSKKGTIETDFLSYGGDIFKSNFQHYGLYKANFNQGELDYLLGRKTDTPFARNYCDFGNDAAQLVLGVKQNRFMTIFMKDEKLRTKMTRLVPDSKGAIRYESEKPRTSAVSIVATLSLSEQDEVEISIENKYGFDLSISRIERQK